MLSPTRFRRRVLSIVPLLAMSAAPAAAGTPPPGFVETVLVVQNSGIGVVKPTAAAYEPGSDNLFVVEKGSGEPDYEARVRVRDAVSGTVSTAVTLDCVDTLGERGLLGIAFHPDYLTPSAGRWVYLYYTPLIDPGVGCAVSGAAAGTKFRVSRFLESAGALSGEEVILEGPYLGAINHNAGALDFGTDGTLFIAVGDNNTHTDPNPLSRDLGDLRGKLLRVNPDGSIPPDNPFVGQPGVREEIWAYGLRNPFRFRVDPETGAPLIGDVGAAKWEAVYSGVAGADYGYPCFEGSRPFRVCNPPPPVGSVTMPIFEYSHTDQSPPVSGNSITGGPRYWGSAFPAEYHGSYFFGDWVDGWIRRGRIAEDGTLVDVEVFMDDTPRVVDLLVTPDDCLLYLTLAAPDLGAGATEVCYSGGSNSQPQAVASAMPQAGLAPLSVTFDGSASSDPDLETLLFSWEFDDGPPDAGEMTSHDYTADGVYQAVLTVDDQQMEANSTDTSAPMTIVVGNREPAATITAPAVAARYDAGATIAFSGSGLDPEDGAMAASQLAWTVIFHHDTHTHPFLGPLQGISAGAFDVPTTGESATDVFYRVYLSATDSGAPVGAGAELTTSTFVDVLPNLADLTLAADPAGVGVELEFDRLAAPAPAVWTSVVGFPRTIGAASPQSTGSGTYFFDSWSDAGAREHVLATPAVDTTYTATFATCTAAADHRALSHHVVSGPESEASCLTLLLSTDYRVVVGGDLALTAFDSIAFGNGFSVETGGQLTAVLAPPI